MILEVADESALPEAEFGGELVMSSLNTIMKCFQSEHMTRLVL